MNENENNSLEGTRENIEENGEAVKNQNEEIESRNNSSRKGKREVVVQYRKPSFFTSLLLFLMGVCVTTAVLGGVYIFKLKDNAEPKAQEPQNQEETPVESKEPEVKVPEINLDINGEFIQGLYKKIPAEYFIDEVYSRRESIVTYDNISGINKTFLVLYNMRKNKEFEEVESTQDLISKYTSGKYYGTGSDGSIGNSHKYDTKVIEEKYKSIFGSDKDIARQNIETHLGYVYEYLADEDTYYGHSYAGGGGIGFIYGTRLLRAEKSEDGREIYLYDNYIKAKEDGYTIENKYGIYAFSEYSNELGRETKVDTNYDYVIRDDIFEKYKDQLATFKHTFKLDTDGNYYWYSTEAVSE